MINLVYMPAIVTNLKSELLDHCIKLQQQKVDIARKAMDDAQESANMEEKSSAGDKYETGRAMSQNTRDMNARQLQEALHQMAILHQIKPEKQFNTAELGALVKTTQGNYFLSISLGAFEHRNEKFFAISPLAPVSQAFLGKKKGQSASFQGKKIEILEIF
jgi:transcription elongation GreA/GreB family factor